jgi:hypothetical protein
MGRPSLGNITISLEQLAIIDGWARRRYENQALLKSDSERTHVQALLKKVEELSAALPEDQTEGRVGLEVVLKLSRKEARLVQRVANEVYARLATVVIPGYADRMSEDPKRYEAYKVAAEAKAKAIVDIVNKVKRSL